MKHKKAIYYDRNGIRSFIDARSLNKDTQIITELKNYSLFDITEEFELSIVDNSMNAKQSHFRLKNSQHTSRFYENSDSDRHDEKITNICNILNGQISTINFVYNDFNCYSTSNQPKILRSLNDFIFEEEVTRETEKGKSYARYDIYGIEKYLSVSLKKPEIIIEVVDEHFQDKDLFNYLIQKTTTSSLFLLYYFIPNESLYNKITIINNSKVEFRVSCYIDNGKFYYCGIPIVVPNHYMQEEINNKYRYYNFIEQKIIKPIRSGKKIKISELK